VEWGVDPPDHLLAVVTHLLGHRVRSAHAIISRRQGAQVSMRSVGRMGSTLATDRSTVGPDAG